MTPYSNPTIKPSLNFRLKYHEPWAYDHQDYKYDNIKI